MITKFDIRGFKSVNDVHLDCRRLNLFIGEPNTGKSNILEALGFLSWCGHGGDLHNYIRFAQVRDLFYDGVVETDCWNLKISEDIYVEIAANYKNGRYEFTKPNEPCFVRLDHTSGRNGNLLKELEFIKFYRFKQIDVFNSNEIGYLFPPAGINLVAQIFSSKELRQVAADYFAPYGLQLVIKPHEYKIEIQKQSEGLAISFPYSLTSDTLQRMIFFSVAMESNKNSTLIFEEPEAHAFPYYTKYFGERIALDENKNQYFIATHNPYLLSAVLEKSPESEVAVYAIYYKNYETRVRLLDKEDLSRLFEADPFLGISQIVGG